LRFAATHASAEEGQEDAYTCFQQIGPIFDTGTEGAPMLRNFSGHVSIFESLSLPAAHTW